MGIPTWNGRVSPVFDVAKRLLVADLDSGAEANREEVKIEEEQPTLRAKRMVELGVTVLVCGAISRPLEAMLAAAGVRVMPQICGPVEEVLQAFTAGRLEDASFRMPGCCGRRLRFRGRRRGGRSRFSVQGDIS